MLLTISAVFDSNFKQGFAFKETSMFNSVILINDESGCYKSSSFSLNEI